MKGTEHRIGTFEEEFLGMRLHKGRLKPKLRSRLWFWLKKRQMLNDRNFVDAEIIKNIVTGNVGKHWVDGELRWNVWVSPHLIRGGDDFLQLEDNHFMLTEEFTNKIAEDLIGNNVVGMIKEEMEVKHGQRGMGTRKE